MTFDAALLEPARERLRAIAEKAAAARRWPPGTPPTLASSPKARSWPARPRGAPPPTPDRISPARRQLWPAEEDCRASAAPETVSLRDIDALLRKLNRNEKCGGPWPRDGPCAGASRRPLF